MHGKDLVDHAPTWLVAMIISAVMAALRVYMDRSETKVARILAESMICAGLTIAAASVIEALGLDRNYELAAGSMIGFIGTHSVRVLAMKFAEKKIK